MGQPFLHDVVARLFYRHHLVGVLTVLHYRLVIRVVVFHQLLAFLGDLFSSLRQLRYHSPDRRADYLVRSAAARVERASVVIERNSGHRCRRISLWQALYRRSHRGRYDDVAIPRRFVEHPVVIVVFRILRRRRRRRRRRCCVDYRYHYRGRCQCSGKEAYRIPGRTPVIRIERMPCVGHYRYRNRHGYWIWVRRSRHRTRAGMRRRGRGRRPWVWTRCGAWSRMRRIRMRRRSRVRSRRWTRFRCRMRHRARSRCEMLGRRRMRSKVRRGMGHRHMTHALRLGRDSHEQPERDRCGYKYMIGSFHMISYLFISR